MISLQAQPSWNQWVSMLDGYVEITLGILTGNSHGIDVGITT